MRRNLKKILAVTLSMAMLTTSVTVNNIVTKADDNAGVAVMADDEQNVKTVTFNSIAIRADKNGIDASWNVPDELVYKTDYTNVRIYISKADDVNRDYVANDYAVAANGHVFSEAYDQGTTNNNQTAVDTVVRNKANTINVYDGNQYVIVVKYVNGTDVVAEGISESISYTNNELNPEKSFNEDAKTMTIKWAPIAGAKKYVVKNGEDVVATVTDMFTKQATINYVEDTEYELTVEAYGDGEEPISSAEIEKFTSPKTTNADIGASVVKGTGTVTWKTITHAKTYKVYVDGEEKEIVNEPKFVLNDMVLDQTYTVKIEAYDENSKLIDITGNEIEITYTKNAPAENDINKVDITSWTKLEVKKGTVDNIYYVNGAHGLSTAVWWGIYAPHSDAAYHGDRTKCELGDASAFVFQFTPNDSITAIWVNGTKYENPSMYFNHQGDCAEIATSVFDQKENVVTLVYTENSTEKMKTFAVKVEAPLEIDATAPATQDTIEPSTVKEWEELVGTTANGSKVSKDKTVEISTNGRLNGCYAADTSAKWNITDIMNSKTVFGLVRGNTDSVIIDGVEYINAKNAKSTKVYIGNDCIYMDAALLDAPEGKTEYHTITLTGSTALTFILKVVGPSSAVDPSKPSAPEGLTNASTDNAPYYFAWQKAEGIKYNVYVDDVILGEQREENTYSLAEYIKGNNLTAGEHVLAVTAVKDNIESDKTTVNFTIAANTVTIGESKTEVVNGGTFTFPTDATGYDLDGALYAPGSKYTVTEDVTFEAVDIKATMATGAGIRFSTDNPGLRFQTTITATKAGTATTDFEKYISEEGTLITTSELNTEKGNPTIESDSVYTVGKDLMQIKNSGWYNGKTGVYYGSVVGIKSYTTNFIARSYVTVKYTDGTVKNIYSDMSGVRTVQQVAQAIINDKNVNETTGKTYYDSLSEANKLIVDAFAGKETSTEQ